MLLTDISALSQKRGPAWFDYFRRNISNWMQNDFYPNLEFSIEFAVQWDEAAVARGRLHHRGRRKPSKWF